jgi:hypothetical protein
MRMPEASVDEDRKFSPLVREIRFPGKIAHIHLDARSREPRPNHRSGTVDPQVATSDARPETPGLMVPRRASQSG